MARSKMPRCPATFDTVRADAIIGDEDPAASVAATHTAAWALMGVGDKIFTDTDVARLCGTVHTSGVDMIAHVWSCSPEFTLPDALWRAYLLYEWYHRGPLLVAERYIEGSRVPITQNLEVPAKLWLLSLIMEEADSLLCGDPTDDDLECMLGEASCAMHVLAAGEAGALWVEDPADSFAHRVAMRHSALLVTVDGLDVAAREVAVGTLDWPYVRCVIADLGVSWAASWKARTGVTWCAHQGTGVRGRLPLSLYVRC